MQSTIDDLVEKFESRRITRRQLVASITALVTGAASASAQPGQPVAPARPVAQGTSLNHISLAVTDVERSADFYSKLLGLKVVSRPGNGGINLGLGNSFLGVYRLPDPGKPNHFSIGVDDYDPERISDALARMNIKATIDRNPANRTSGGDQLYFNDPDNTRVQLSPTGYQG